MTEVRFNLNLVKKNIFMIINQHTKFRQNFVDHVG